MSFEQICSVLCIICYVAGFPALCCHIMAHGVNFSWI